MVAAPWKSAGISSPTSARLRASAPPFESLRKAGATTRSGSATGMSQDVAKLEHDLEMARQEAQAARREAGEMRRQLELDRTAKQASEQGRDQSANTNGRAQKTDRTPTAAESNTENQPLVSDKDHTSTFHEVAGDAKPSQDAPTAAQSPTSPSTTLQSSTDRSASAQQESKAISSIAKETLPSKSDTLKTQKRDQGRSLSSLQKRHLHRDAASQKAWPYSEWH